MALVFGIIMFFKNLRLMSELLEWRLLELYKRIECDTIKSNKTVLNIQSFQIKQTGFEGR